jgi:hypothetical protein
MRRASTLLFSGGRGVGRGLIDAGAVYNVPVLAGQKTAIARQDRQLVFQLRSGRGAWWTKHLRCYTRDRVQ